MLNRTNKSKTNSNHGKVDTLIGHETEVIGDVRFAGGLHIDGVVKGNVAAVTGSADALAIVSERGRVEGELRVPHLIINGHVTGDVHASERLDLAKDARVYGDVHYRTMEMASGAEVNGQLVRIDAEPHGFIEHQQRDRVERGDTPDGAAETAESDTAGIESGVSAESFAGGEKT